ncbi:MAG: glycosyltransferase [Bacteroidetes bacterium]|nr:glycosyltransferase [Bacteroidota bacterium]
MVVNVGIINYNGEKTLPQVIDILLGQNHVNLAIKVYDNCSTDGSLQCLKKYDSQIEVEKMSKNLGPNPARNKAIKDSIHDYTLIMDNDIYFKKDGISKLVQILEASPNCMACSPLIAYNSEKDAIQYNGVKIHYIGGAIINTGKISELQDRNYFKSTCLGAGALLLRNCVVEEIGFFDEDFFFGWEDGDFTFRITSAGYDCLAAPEVVAYHDAEKREISKMYFQIRNRWFFILKNYSFHTILLIFPALLIYELFLGMMLILKKSFFIYLKANWSVLKNLALLVKKHNTVKKSKRVKDRELLHSGELYATSVLGSNKIFFLLKSIVTTLFNTYWMFVKLAI